MSTTNVAVLRALASAALRMSFLSEGPTNSANRPDSPGQVIGTAVADHVRLRVTLFLQTLTGHVVSGSIPTPKDGVETRTRRSRELDRGDPLGK